MSAKYRYGEQSKKHTWKPALIAISVPLVFVGLAVAIIAMELKNQNGQEVEGKTRVVSQVLGNSQLKVTVNEPLFTLQLPAEWREYKRVNTASEKSISWSNDTRKSASRTITLYIDAVPSVPVNRMLPITAQGNTLSYGSLSENCASFTQGGTMNAQAATLLKPAMAKWQGVDFLCDLTVITENAVGTGSKGEQGGTTVRGEAQGTHKYFFVYTDHDIQPDYTNLYNVIRSFRAK